jgi:hypothetical protein
MNASELGPVDRAKIEELQEYLKELGVVDIKFFKGEDWDTITVADKAQEIIRVLEALRNGHYTEFKGLGDKVVEGSDYWANWDSSNAV